MLKKNEVPVAWENFKQAEGNADFPTVFHFTLLGSTYYGAQDKKGKFWTRKSLLGLSGLVNITLKKLKDIK